MHFSMCYPCTTNIFLVLLYKSKKGLSAAIDIVQDCPESVKTDMPPKLPAVHAASPAVKLRSRGRPGTSRQSRLRN